MKILTALLAFLFLISVGSAQSTSTKNVTINVAPAVTYTPTSLSFPSTPVGSTSATQTFVINNIGSVTVGIASITLSGTNSGDFSETSSCGSTILASGSCNITVSFTPTATGSRTAQVNILNNTTSPAHTYVATLAGIGGSPVVAYYVSTTGSDANPGTLASPFATLGKCQSAMRASSNKTCIIRGGTYSPTAVTITSGGNTVTYSLYLTSADNGETWQYYNGDGYDTAIIDGGSSATGNGTNEGIVIDGGSSIVINGLQLRHYGWVGIGVHGGSGNYAQFPFNVGQAANNIIENNIVHDTYGYGGIGFGYSGIQCAYVNAINSSCLNNVVYNVDTDGIRASTGNLGIGGNNTGLTISGNVVYKALNSAYTDGGCIYYQNNDQTSTGITISNNFVRDCGTVAQGGKSIYLDDGASNATETGNVMTGTAQMGSFFHEGCCTTISGNVIDLGNGNNQSIVGQQLQNTSQGDQHNDFFENNIIISGGGGGGYLVGGPNTLTHVATVQNNGYYNYSGSAINYNCTGLTGLGCPHDTAPYTGHDPLFSGCYALSPSSPMLGSPVNFPGLPTSWGPPGYVIPNSGTVPSYASPTC